MRSKITIALTGAVALVAVGATPAWAATTTWDDGGAPDDTFDNPANWAGDTVPATGDDLVFPVGDGATQDISSPFLVNSITLSVPGFELTGAELAIGAGGMTVTEDATIGNEVSTTGTQTWTVASGKTLTIDDTADVTGFLQVEGAGVVDFGAVNGSGILTAQQSASIVLDEGGDVQGLAIHGNGTINVASELAGTGVNLDGGHLSGGSLGNLGLQQIGDIAANNGVLSPGADLLGEEAGWLLTGNVPGSSGAAYRMTLDGTDSDRIVSSGVVAPGNMALDVRSDLAAPVGTAFVIVEADGGIAADSFYRNPLTGEPLADGAEFFNGQANYRIEYNTTEIVLTFLGVPPAAQPELAATGVDIELPVALAGLLLLTGAGFAVAATRRRTV